MNESKTLPSYRFVFMAILCWSISQCMTHASFERPAEVYYSGKFDTSFLFNIDYLTMVYKLVLILISFQASYVIDTYGIRTGLKIGSAILVIFRIGKALFARNYGIMAVSRAGLAIIQPFNLNAVTAFSVRWFPLTEKSLATRLSSPAQYLGIWVAIALAPLHLGSQSDHKVAA